MPVRPLAVRPFALGLVLPVLLAGCTDSGTSGAPDTRAAETSVTATLPTAVPSAQPGMQTGTQTGTQTGPQQSSSAGAWVPYSLYTHCGIDEAKVAGRWYRASPPLSDGQGNPPPGWNNPMQDGQVRVVSPTEVEFRDDRGHHVRFTLQPGTTPAKICS